MVAQKREFDIPRMSKETKYREAHRLMDRLVELKSRVWRLRIGVCRGDCFTVG
jgi:hypothetical protein